MSDQAPLTFAVGIDLGTTNCTLAKTERLESGVAPPVVVDIPQVTHAGEVAAKGQLPSFLYLPPQAEIDAQAVQLPWAAERRFAVGTFAKARGAEVPGRVVTSAKSWLSHKSVDRKAAILPPEAADDVEKMSPLLASTRYLEHLKDAWDAEHPDALLAAQDLVITVPASFDADARALTEEAATLAGLDANLVLLEEPQAALYAWVAQSKDAWRKQVDVGDTILVCDIGGGTCDFSLIAVTDDDGTLGLSRVAVGEHILLGGDNMDLALAFALKQQLEDEGRKIDDWQLRAMTHGCRAAKEALLGEGGESAHPVVIPSRGSKLIGGAIRSEVSRALAEQVLLEGFFPKVSAEVRPAVARRVGLTTLGLPYASDAAVTKHLAAFLGRAGQEAAFAAPTAILFNGGVTRSPAICARLLEVLGGWLADAGAPPLKVLEGTDPDQAVALGAAYFAASRKGEGVRIKGGTARSYFVGIERAEMAVPGMPPRVDAVCVAPRGMEEGTEVTLDMELGAVVGEPAGFRFFSRNIGDDAVGTKADPADLEELPLVETTLDGQGTEPGSVVPVKMSARVSEIGTLDLGLRMAGGEGDEEKRWRLSFQIRTE